MANLNKHCDELIDTVKEFIQKEPKTEEIFIKDIIFMLADQIIELKGKVEQWEKGYFYFKEDLENCAYTDHRKCTDVIELDELENLTSLMDELWREKMESLKEEDEK